MPSSRPVRFRLANGPQGGTELLIAEASQVVSRHFASSKQLDRWFRDVDGCAASPDLGLANTTSGILSCDVTEAMTKISDLHRRWRKDADYKAAYDALGEEFDLARALIEARAAAGLSQSQLAKKMKTSQSYIARIEGGKVRPSTDALERFAQATRTRLRIIFEPEAAR